MISSIRQMLAQGAPASFRRFSQVLASSLASASSMIARNAASFSVRWNQSPKRGSSSTSARPSAVISASYCRSLFTASSR